MSIKFSNNATTTLAADLTADSLTVQIPVADLAKFPTLVNGTDFFVVTLTSTHPTGKMEIVHVTGIDYDNGVCTITRAQEGTTAQAFVVNDKFEHRLTAGSLDTIMKNSSGGVVSPSMLYIGNIFGDA